MGWYPSEGGSRRKEKKKHTLERKAKRQKNFHVIQEATALWEKLRQSLPVYFKAFKGKAPELLRHPAGTHVLDDLYSVAHVEQRRMMAAEFYGKEYALFDSGTLNNTKGAPESLSQLLSAVEGQKQLAIIRHVASTLTPVIEKGLVDNQLAHTLISEYMKAAPSSLVEDSVETLILDEWGWLAIATALSVTDDTALLRKIIISELESEISQVVQDKHAHKYTSDIVVELCVGGENNFLEELSGVEDIDAIHKAVLESADTLLTDYYGSRALRRIILASNEKNGDSAKRFTELLWKNHMQGTCKKLKDSHAAKIVAAFIHCGCPDIASKAKKEIKVKDPVAWADKFTGKKH
eukprot:jgi/Picre1/28221/NNA_003627.t1